MANSSFTRILIATPFIAVLAACGGEATTGDGDGTAAGDAPPAITERQENFKKIGDAFKAIREELEGETPDLAFIKTQAEDIGARAETAKGLFPEGTSIDDGYDTEALATIWEKPEEFGQKAQALVDATAEMARLAEAGDAAGVAAAVGTVGKSCKGCHDNFRVKKD
ncbi:MAG: cytochrome c [Pseudomonadota bacterium]